MTSMRQRVLSVSRVGTHLHPPYGHSCVIIPRAMVYRPVLIPAFWRTATNICPRTNPSHPEIYVAILMCVCNFVYASNFYYTAVQRSMFSFLMPCVSLRCLGVSLVRVGLTWKKIKKRRESERIPASCDGAVWQHHYI